MLCFMDGVSGDEESLPNLLEILLEILHLLYRFRMTKVPNFP
ncbi:hypothetical protein [Helicobacter marmotae]|nr:hypothetical protein [Helicobacter marmotae]